MNQWLIAILIVVGILHSTQSVVQAALPSNYGQFIQSLDSIVTGATMPVVDEQLGARLHSSPTGQAIQILAVAREMLGRSVVWGGSSPSLGFDCSGLVQYVYRQVGINLPRTADLQFLVGRTVLPSELRPGDLVYYTTYEPGASHVGIYIGGDRLIHTSFSQNVVAIADMKDPYFIQRYYGAKRVL